MQRQKDLIAEPTISHDGNVAGLYMRDDATLPPANRVSDVIHAGWHAPRSFGLWNARRIRSFMRNGVLGGEIAILLLAPVVAALSLDGFILFQSFHIYLVESFFITSLVALTLAGQYNQKPPSGSILAFLTAPFVILLSGATVMAAWAVDIRMTHQIATWFTSVVLVATIGVTLVRGAASTLTSRLIRSGALVEKAVVVGADGRVVELLRRCAETPSPELDIVGIFDDRLTRVPRCVEGYPVLGTTDDLVGYVRANGIDRVVVTLPWSAEDRITRIVTKLRQLPAHIDMVPHSAVWNYPSDMKCIAGVPVVTVANRRLDSQLGLVKRLEDVVLGSMIVLLFAPIFIAAAIAIKLDSPGPVLFRQKRVGFNNREFNVYKFRSMYHNLPADPNVKQASKHDPRVTRVGRFLRRTSLDELPQLLNVLEGTMSIVGPRPHAVAHHHQYGDLIDAYCARHNVKPGITGWAQIMGYRGETDTDDKMRRRVECDIYYIENWSLAFDIKIIIMTGLKVWFQKTAY